MPTLQHDDDLSYARNLPLSKEIAISLQSMRLLAGIYVSDHPTQHFAQHLDNREATEKPWQWSGSPSISEFGKLRR